MIDCGWGNRGKYRRYSVSADSKSYSNLYCFEFDSLTDVDKIIKKIKLMNFEKFKVYGNGRNKSTEWLSISLLHQLHILVSTRKRK